MLVARGHRCQGVAVADHSRLRVEACGGGGSSGLVLIPAEGIGGRIVMSGSSYRPMGIRLHSARPRVGSG